MSETSSDRIEKQIVLKSPVARVWRALTDTAEFGVWFRVNLQGAFVVGQTISGNITHKGYEHLTMEITVEAMETERLFAYRWHPYAIDPKVDYSKEPSTLVVFTLTQVPEGTRLSVVESGFDRLPAARRAEAFRMNDSGWTSQMQNIERHVAG
jgi:uncharacterized protein YndB with AHSA1/START domain